METLVLFVGVEAEQRSRARALPAAGAHACGAHNPQKLPWYSFQDFFFLQFRVSLL